MSSLRDAVRDKLREDKVKLWLPPYDTSDAVDALAKTYAAALQASDQDVTSPRKKKQRIVELTVVAQTETLRTTYF